MGAKVWVMTSAKGKSVSGKKAATRAAGSAAKPAKKNPAGRLIARRSDNGRFVVYDTPVEPKHTTRQRIVGAIAKVA
jgi:hypothetical protein